MYATCANARSFRKAITHLALVVLASVWLPACAQTPEQPPQGTAYEPAFSAEEIAELVAPIALYPDDLLAIVLPASSYPLQIVEAQRYLDAVAKDPSRKPPEDWDDSVVALLNYPEVVKFMNDDLDWTQKLGEAVLTQQPEVLAAIEGFRRRAYTSGNLRSDDRQVVEVEDDAIRIRPADPQVIYVPYYEPAAVTVYRTVPAYYYYPRPYPVYYYPYPADYVFASGFFWGVTTFYTLGWHTHHIHTYYYDYDHHPYYGRPYYNHRHYYRRPPPPRVGHDYRVNDGSWDRHEYPRDRDRQYYDRDGDRTPDGHTTKPRDAYRTTTAARDSAETYWRPDYRRTGARPGADPHNARYQRGAPRQQRVVQTAPEGADARGGQPSPSTRPVPTEREQRQGEPRGSSNREQYRERAGEPPNGSAGGPSAPNGSGMTRGQPREGSLQQRVESQRRREPAAARAPDAGLEVQAPAQAQELRRLERQEQEQLRRQIEHQERGQREFEQRGRAEAQRQYEQQQRAQTPARDAQEQRQRTQRQFEQQDREQIQRQYEPQRYREEQGGRAQRQYEQPREQEQQRRYQPDTRQQQPRYEREARDRGQPQLQQQFAPQSWQQRQSVPQPRGGNDVRMQPRTPDAPRNYRNEMNEQRGERPAPQSERREVEARRAPRTEQGGERSDGNARGGEASREPGSRSIGREANGSWMRH